MPIDMASLAVQAAKLASNDKARAVGGFLGKMTYLQMTNPVAFVGIEAAHGAIEAAAVSAVTGQKDTPSQFAQEAIKDVGIGYTLHTGTLMGLQALAKSDYGSNLAGDAVDAIIKNITKGTYAPAEGTVTVGDLVANSMRKFVPAVKLAPLKFGAVGAAAGLLYAGLNDKKDGTLGTTFDMLGGAGLAMLGHEMYHHFQSKEGAHEESKLPTTSEAIEKVLGSNSEGAKTAQKLYLDNQSTIHSTLSKMGLSADDLNVLHEGMTTGLTKTIKHLDDETTREVLEGPQIKDVVEQSIETSHPKKETTVKDIVRHDGINEHEISQRSIESQKKITGWKEKGKMLGALGLGAFAVATAVDISQRLDHSKETSKMTNQEKKNQEKKAHQQKMQQWQQSYGYINMGDMVTQMFQDRIGHHKMGNQKFAPNQYMIQGQAYNI
jgi:hypothetical protein